MTKDDAMEGLRLAMKHVHRNMPQGDRIDKMSDEEIILTASAAMMILSTSFEITKATLMHANPKAWEFAANQIKEANVEFLRAIVVDPN